MNISFSISTVAFAMAATFAFGENVTDAAASSTPNAPSAPEVRMAISNEHPDKSLYVPDHYLVAPSFRNAEPDIQMPARARLDKVFDGSATVGVMIDADGKPTDFLIVKYSKPYFAEELLNTIKREEYLPRRVKGDCVPGRFNVTKVFSLGEGSSIDPNHPAVVSMTSMDQIGARSDRLSEGRDGPKPIYKAHHESEIEGRVLRAVSVVTPALPDDFKLTPDQTVKVLVTFYVDEKGDVRLPNVESNVPAALIKSVVKAISGWKFAPPTMKGKPVLAYASRTLSFSLKDAAASAPTAGTPQKQEPAAGTAKGK